MSIGRDTDIDYHLRVDGAGAVTAAIQATDAAAGKAAKSSKDLEVATKGAAGGLEKMGKSAASAKGGLGGVEGALEKITGPTGKALRVLNDVGDVFKLMGAGLAGGALFGGLQDIAEALKAMYTMAERALDPSLWAQAQGIVKHEKAIADAANEATKALREQALAQQAAGASAGERAIEVLGSGADPAAVGRALNIGRQLEELVQQRRRILEGVADYSSNAMVSERILEIQAQIEGRRKELRGLTEVGPSIAAPSRGAKPPSAAPSRGAEPPSESQIMADIMGGPSDPWPWMTAEAKGGGGNLGRPSHSVNERGPRDGIEVPSVLASLTASDDERQRHQEDVARAMDSADAMERALGRVAAQSAEAGEAGRSMGVEMGRGLSHAAAAAILTGESFKAATNLMMQGLAVKAGGEAIWETAQGIAQTARYISSYGLDAAAAASAAEHFSAAGMYLSIAAVAGAAAMATGGMGGGAGGVGNGGASSGGGGGMSNPYQSQGGGPTQVTVYIGGELVTGAVIAETKQAERRGGKEPRMARAA